jgi:predicted metal-dependent peptidase
MGMLKTQVRGDVSRTRMDISDEVNSILMTEPFLMTFVHQLKHYRMLPEDAEIIACTDGKIVEYGPKYEMLELPERTYICVHEIGHGIFLHSMRAMLWMMYNGFLFPALWNYAADVVINEGIEANPMMRTGMFRTPRLFPPCRMKTTIHDEIAEVARITGEKPPADYSPLIYRDLRVEALYEWLVWALFAMRRFRNQDPMTGKPMGGEGEKGEKRPGSGGAGQEGSGEEGEDSPDDEGSEGSRKRQGGKPGRRQSREVPLTGVERMEREDAWDLREHLDDVRRKLDEGQSSDQIVKSIETEIEQARARIQEAVAGMKVAGAGQGSMLMNLSSDLPKPTVPWYRIIRDVIDGALGTKLSESYTRPGNATLCAMALGRRSLPVSHGTTIYSPRPRIMIGLDVSGSMMPEIRRCCAEIWSMAQMKGADIDLLTWDYGVQEILTIRSKRDFDRILKKGLRGGGGTTVVRKVFDHAERHGHKAIVMMTDGYVNIDLPVKPRIPVIWAITPGGATTGLEQYGTIVRMAREARVAVDETMLRMAA